VSPDLTGAIRRLLAVAQPPDERSLIDVAYCGTRGFHLTSVPVAAGTAPRRGCTCDVGGRILAVLLAIGLSACGTAATSGQPSATPPCQTFAPPPPSVGAEIHHLKTSASVIQVTSACTVRVLIAGGGGTLATFTNTEIVLRATSRTTFVSASQGDLEAIGRFGSYPINGMNR
jgi:hypothetical protein